VLSRRRQSGMAANPLSCLEIETFARRRHIELSTWEFDLICRLDDAVLAVWRGDGPKSRPAAKAATPNAIPVTDTGGIRGLFRGIAAAMGGQKAKASPPPAPAVPSRRR
jgi:hypothetical protein